MISLLILICAFITLAVILKLRQLPPPVISGPQLFISCSRPSERIELACWLFTISLWNRGTGAVTIERMDIVLPSGTVLPVLTPPKDHPRAAVYHHMLTLPQTVPAETSVIVIASVTSETTGALTSPEQCRLRVSVAGSISDYPLFRMSFS